jgi:DNA-binding transcriptional LysR family regulator
VVITAKERSDIGDSIDAETFQLQRYASFRNDASGSTSFAELQLAKNQISPTNTLFVPNFLLFPFLVASTQCIALIHRRLAERMSALLPIKLVRPLFELEPLRVNAYWAHKAQNNPGHRWFREQLNDVCRDLNS